MRSASFIAPALVITCFGCAPTDAGTEGTDSSVPVYVEPVTRSDITEKLTYVADLEPYAEVSIYSPLADRIVSFPWENGQSIKRGQRVASIRKEGLDRGIEGVIAQADALDVQIRHLEAELKRSQDLLDAGVITRQTFDQLQTSLESTRAQRRALDASRAQMAVTANNAVITAPIDGVIGGKMLQIGDMAAPQLPLARIMQIDKLKAKLQLVEFDVSKVKLGHEVRLSFDAFAGKTFQGHVTSIMPYLDAGTRTNTVEVTVDNPEVDGQRRLKPGMFGRAVLVLEERAAVVVAPEHALLLDNQLLEKQGEGTLLRKAFVVDDDRIAHRRLVRLGARNGNLFEILEGLSEGERLVVRGQHGLRDGARVEFKTPGIAATAADSAAAREAAGPQAQEGDDE